MIKITTTILLFFCITSAYSQTIINAERLLDGADSSIISLSVSYSGTRGNSTIDQVDLSPAYVLLTKRNEYKLFGGYSLLSNEGDGLLNSGFVHARHNYIIQPRLKTFEFYQLQYNDQLLLERRQVFGAGLRYSLVAKDSVNIDFELGLMRDMEIYNQNKLLEGENRINYNTRITFVNSSKIYLSKYIKINNVIYYQPAIDDFSDFRVLNDFNLSIKVTNHLSVINALTLRYSSKPPGGLKNLDASMKFGGSLKF